MLLFFLFAIFYSQREIVRVNNFSPREFDNWMEFGSDKGAIVECPVSKVPYYYMMSSKRGLA